MFSLSSSFFNSSIFSLVPFLFCLTSISKRLFDSLTSTYKTFMLLYIRGWELCLIFENVFCSVNIHAFNDFAINTPAYRIRTFKPFMQILCFGSVFDSNSRICVCYYLVGFGYSDCSACWNALNHNSGNLLFYILCVI